MTHVLCLFQVTSGMTYHFYNVPLVDSDCRKEGQCADMDLTSCAANDHGMVSTALYQCDTRHAHRTNTGDYTVTYPAIPSTWSYTLGSEIGQTLVTTIIYPATHLPTHRSPVAYQLPTYSRCCCLPAVFSFAPRDTYAFIQPPTLSYQSTDS